MYAALVPFWPRRDDAKRARQGLQTLMFDTCPQCGGTGYMLSGRTVYMQIVRRIRELFKSGRIKTNLEIEVHRR